MSKAYYTIYDGAGRMNMLWVGGYTVAFTSGNAQAIPITTLTGNKVSATTLKWVWAMGIGAANSCGITSAGSIVIGLPHNSTFTGNINFNFIVFYKNT